MGWKGGQCGEYGDWGCDWTQKQCKEIFGDEVVITQITAEGRFSNHNASRVITPNGERYVIDYWQGMQDKQALYTEDEWITQQAEAGRGKVVRSHSGDRRDIYQGGEEGMLNWSINKYGEKEGIRKFLTADTKQVSLEKKEAIVRSYQRSPWPTK